MAEEREPIDGLAGESVAVVAGDRDSAAIEAILAPEGAEVCRYALAELCEGMLRGHLSMAVIAEDLLSDADVRRLRDSVARQPDWCDFAILLLVERGALEKRAELLDLGQVRIIERPLHAVTLSGMLRSACRSRFYQSRAKALASELVVAEAHCQDISHGLEHGLAGKIADLEALRDRLTLELEERKHTEELLRQSEEFYRFTIELGQHMVWSIDADGNQTSFGDRFSQITGMPLGMRWEDMLRELVHPDDVDEMAGCWDQERKSDEPHVVEFRMRVADGSYRHFVTRAAPRPDANGAITRWYGFTEDVTEQKLATEALRQAEERYRLAARATNDAIWDWDLQTDEIQWSDAAATYLGSLAGTKSDFHWWESAIHPDDRGRVLRSINGAIESDKSRWSAAYRMCKADGEYAYVYDRGFIIRNAEGEALRAVGAVVDLTERRRAEAELRRTQAELIHVSRVSAMGTMASTLAHELNQPLTAVTSYVRGSRRLLDTMKEPGAQQVSEALEYAEAGALRAGQIVRRIRELVSRGTVSVGPEDLCRLMDDASVLAFVDEHLHGISHKIEIDPDARWVDVDRIQIQQVLINLIRNAVQALQNSKRREVTISCKSWSDDMVVVTVSDTGAGIPASVRDALFSPFHSTKPGGMGIGLSISRTIVEAHHGKIWAEDGGTGGAVFRFTLPRADTPAEERLDISGSERGRNSAV